METISVSIEDKEQETAVVSKVLKFKINRTVVIGINQLLIEIRLISLEITE